jgi:hypothetical protein
MFGQKGKSFIHHVCGKFLFLGCAVDSTHLVPIGAITLQSASPTEETMANIWQLLGNIATQDEAVLTYNHSNMKSADHSDASDLNEQKSSQSCWWQFLPVFR